MAKPTVSMEGGTKGCGDREGNYGSQFCSLPDMKMERRKDGMTFTYLKLMSLSEL